MKIVKWFYLVLVTLIALPLFSVTAEPEARKGASKFISKPTTVAERTASFEKRTKLAKSSIFKNMEFRCVGPTVMSGRVTEIQPYPTDPYSFFVSYATGGLWRTTTNGMDFESIFEGQNAVAIGGFAVDAKNPDVIWVGTGEGNGARSHYSGTGIYKTTDGGKTWANMGLEDTHHIARVVVDPTDSNVVYVAANGHLYTNNEMRGLFKTTDGGKTWKKVLYVNDRTGVVDVVLTPGNPKVVYAAAWEKDRKAWDVVENGEGSGIYKSMDAGKTWDLLTKGLPTGALIGRIGLAVSASNPEVVYALVDNHVFQEEEEDNSAISAKKLQNMSKKDVLKVSEGDLEKFIRGQGFHKDHTGKSIRKELEEDKITVQDMLDYIVRLRPDALDSEVIGGEVYRTVNAGKLWEKMNLDYLSSLVGGSGYYFGQIRVSPTDEDRIYIMGVPLLTSGDAGKTYKWIGGKDMHVDHHALWIDPANPDHIIAGNDGGLNQTYNGGESWLKLNHIPIGQFYAINVDMAQPYNIYGGLQDNGTYKGSSKSIPGKTAEWEHIWGGDGFYVEIAPDFTTYLGSQFGNYGRLSPDGKRATVKPQQPKMDEPGLRFNWQTPILLSTHSPNVLYYGANRVFRSLDQGMNLKAISPVLTEPKESGNVPFGTLTTIAESKQTFGILYAGSDDGRIHMTPDGGFSWKEIGKSLPQGLWCTRLETSHHTDGVVYVSLNAYRKDDFRTLLYRSENFGKTWKSIKGNLPEESVNVICEDPKNENVLYVGTDMGVFVSVNSGKWWHALTNGIPITPAHDLVIHPRDRDLVVGTHGRSIYVMNVALIQDLTPETMKKKLHIFDVAKVSDSESWNRKPSIIERRSSDRSHSFQYWLGKGGMVKVTIKDDKDKVFRSLEQKGTRGINVLEWDLEIDRDLVLPGKLEEAKETLKKAEKKLANVGKPEEQKKDTEKKDADAKKDEAKAEGKKEEKKEVTKEEIEEKKIALQAEVKKAQKRIEELEEIIAEVKKYADAPDSVKNVMIRKVYLPKGKYTVEFKIGKTAEKATLEVTGGESGGGRRSRQPYEEEEEGMGY